MGGFNGSGVYQRFYNWVNDAAASIKIRADRFDTECDGFAQGLSTCITKDGQTTVTANLPMSTYRHTGVGAASSRTDYARLDQLQDGKINWVAAGGTADAITASYSIPLTTLADGQLCFVRAGAANATTTPTFSPNGITARTIVKEGGSALAVGDIAGSGHELVLRYNLDNTRWELLNPAQPTVSTEFSDSTFRIQDNSDATKEIAFEASDITTGTTRTVTVPDSSGTILYVGQVLDEDDMATDSAVYPPTQQSVKAYVDGASVVAGYAKTISVTPASTTSTIPHDNTKPQNTEGAEAFTVAYTPTNASNLLRVHVSVPAYVSTNVYMTLALFKDSDADALACQTLWNGANGDIKTFVFDYWMTAGTTSEITFKLRYGATGGTMNITTSFGSTMGGIITSSLEVTEYKV